MSTDKTKMSNLESYQELTIQISTLNLKLDAILKLLNKPEVKYEIGSVINFADHMHTGNLATSLDEEFAEAYK